MARKTKIVTIKDEGRDRGKAFLITEAPAWQTEKWAMRAFLALANSGVEISPEVARQGLAGLLLVGFQSLTGLHYDAIEPLLDEMFECIACIPEPNKEFTRKLVDTDTEEVRSRLTLRMEVVNLHLGFSLADAASTLMATAAPAPPQT